MADQRLKLTDTVIRSVVKSIGKGLSPRLALQKLGIAGNTFYDWRKKALDPDEEEPLYGKFLNAVEKAESQYIEKHLDNIQEAAAETYKASTWLLSNRFSPYFGNADLRYQMEQEKSEATDKVAEIAQKYIPKDQHGAFLKETANELTKK